MSPLRPILDVHLGTETHGNFRALWTLSSNQFSFLSSYHNSRPQRVLTI